MCSVLFDCFSSVWFCLDLSGFGMYCYVRLCLVMFCSDLFESDMFGSVKYGTVMFIFVRAVRFGSIWSVLFSSVRSILLGFVG